MAPPRSSKKKPRNWRRIAAWTAGVVAAIGLGFVVTIMFVLGPIFALLWGTAYLLGRKIERERAAAYAALEAQGGIED